MRRYSVLHALPLSFYSRSLYREVARAWRGAGLLYLLLLAALPAALVVVHGQMGLREWVRTDAAHIAGQIPPIHIRHGVVQVDCPLPLTISDSRGKPFAVIDTAGSVPMLEETGAWLMLTRDHFYVHRPQRDTRVYELSTVVDFALDRDRANGWLRTMLFWSVPGMAFFTFAGLYVFRLVQVLIGAGLALLVAGASRVPLTYGAGMRLAAVALTPAIVIELALDAANARPPHWALAWSVIALAFIVMAVRWNRGDADDAPGPAPAVGGQE